MNLEGLRPLDWFVVFGNVNIRARYEPPNLYLSDFSEFA
jgi:hypothetical protein